MNHDPNATVLAVIAKAPEWLRLDLVARDAISRARAEEALGAMIANALQTTNPNG